jgi:quercetin dioxygenase-like cupin family protein
MRLQAVALPGEGDIDEGVALAARTCSTFSTGEPMTDARQHFTTEAAGTATAPGRFVDVDAISSLELVPGLLFQPVLGERTMLNFVSFAPHTEAPMHVHEEEQIVLVLEGEFEFDIDGDVRTMRAGDVAIVPSWVRHGARTRDASCREVDVFNPPRRSLLEHAQGQATPPREGV